MEDLFDAGKMIEGKPAATVDGVTKEKKKRGRPHGTGVATEGSKMFRVILTPEQANTLSKLRTTSNKSESEHVRTALDAYLNSKKEPTYEIKHDGKNKKRIIKHHERLGEIDIAIVTDDVAVEIMVSLANKAYFEANGSTPDGLLEMSSIS